MENPSNFSDLYKSHAIRSKESRQSERRSELLEKQKRKREDFVDNLRCIDSTKKKAFGEPKSSNQHFRLQLSEWLLELPDDLTKWYIRPCPKGQRCLIIATNGKTCMYNKYGAFLKTFHSMLPGCGRSKRDDLTVLDCVYVPNEKVFFILDVIVYNSLDLSDCEAEFRLYWIEGKVQEDNLNIVNDRNAHAFEMVGKVDCGDVEAFNELVTVHPIWSNDSPQLDGFLFYHKESAYIQGSTPLVGWLFSFMLPEIFNLPTFNGCFMVEKPSNYKNYMAFIEEFDQMEKSKKKPRNKTRTTPMDTIETIETGDESNSNIVKDTMRLELDLDLDELDEIHG